MEIIYNIGIHLQIQIGDLVLSPRVVNKWMRTVAADSKKGNETKGKVEDGDEILFLVWSAIMSHLIYLVNFGRIVYEYIIRVVFP